MFSVLAQSAVSLVESGNSYLFLLPIYGALIGGERLAHWRLRRQEVWNDLEAASNLFITGVFLLLNMLFGHLLPLAAMAALHESYALFHLGFGVSGWLAAALLHDFVWYVDHRIAHRVGFFWSMHHVHHSSPGYNMTVASRGFWLDSTLLSRPFFFVLPLLGLSPLHFMVVSIATNIWGIAQHTRLVGKLPVLDLVFATPSNHRVHHGTEAKYIDRNFGETLMIWDHLFGSYQREEEEPTYGVTQPITTSHPLRIELAGVRWLTTKIRAADSFRLKCLCLVRPPEWKVDGDVERTGS